MKKKKKSNSEIPKKNSLSKKENKLFENLLKTTEQFILGKNYPGLRYPELIDKLSIPEVHHSTFKKVLQTLIKDGFIICEHERYLLKKPKADVVKGFLHMHPRGFGFLQPHEKELYPQDIFIPKHLTQNAVHGDIVEVVINPNSMSEKGPEGKVVAILERARTHMGAIIQTIEKDGTILAYAPMLGTQQKVIVEPSKDFSLKVGDRIVMEVKEWGSKESATKSVASHFIGHIEDASCDIRAAIEEFEIRSDFPLKVIEEAEKFGKIVSREDIKNRTDFRDLVTITIDPDTAKDFDDAINLTKDEKGIYHLGVHIADVSHYVKKGTELDLEAFERSNSTYFPGVCVPMLPYALSNNLCSLKPNVNRLAVSVLMDFDSDGNLLNHQMTKSVIKSKKRFTYKEAKLVLDGKKKSVYESHLKLMVELCSLLKKKRYERGSIEFAIPELVVIVDENGVPTKTDYIEYDITHQLVEEFMLKANEIVATHLSQIGKGLTYRVHDIPADENMKDFSILASAFGFKLSEVPTSYELQKLFEEAKETPYGEYLATSYIRKLRLAVYSAENIGHYGLGLTHYCHFTSPIRRYVDLVVHRILFDEAMSNETLAMISEKCSEQERISAKAEGSVILLKKLRLLQSIYDKEPEKQFEAVVTKVKNFGITFEVLDLMLESFLHISDLQDDYYVFDEGKQKLQGRNRGCSFFSGDRITVMLSSLNFITKESIWKLVSVDQRFEEPKTMHLKDDKKNLKKSFKSSKPNKKHASSKNAKSSYFKKKKSSKKPLKRKK